MSAEEGESKITTEQTSTKNNSSATNNRETSADTSKENSKASEVQKPDYIHVRARRGQATDSHSLAERVSRNHVIFFLQASTCRPISIFCFLVWYSCITRFAGEKGKDQRENEVSSRSSARVQQDHRESWNA